MSAYGVVDPRALEHAIAKAKDQLARTADTRKRRRIEGQIHHLSSLLDVAKAALREAKRVANG